MRVTERWWVHPNNVHKLNANDIIPVGCVEIVTRKSYDEILERVPDPNDTSLTRREKVAVLDGVKVMLELGDAKTELETSRADLLDARARIAALEACVRAGDGLRNNIACGKTGTFHHQADLGVCGCCSECDAVAAYDAERAKVRLT